MDDVIAHTFGVHLLCREVPRLAKASMFEAFWRRCPDVEPLDPDMQSPLLGFVHKDHPIELADATIAAQTLITRSEKLPRAEQLASALQQTWDFEQARAAVERCRASVVTDVMSSGLDPAERIEVFQRTLRAVLDSVTCEAVHWLPSDSDRGSARVDGLLRQRDAGTSCTWQARSTFGCST